MIGIVIVSHSPKIAAGVKDLADQMTQGRVKIVAAGGLDDDTIGTNAERIHAALVEAAGDGGTLVLVDLGSAVMSAQAAIEMLPDADRARVSLSNAPLVEGAVVAAVEASIGKSLSEVRSAAESASEFDKLA